jgi:hypothetical protein
MNSNQETPGLWLGVAIFAVTLRVFAGAQAGHNENHCGG